MNNIKLMNKIAKVGTDVFDPAKYTVGADVEAADAIMVRSAALHDLEFNPELRVHAVELVDRYLDEPLPQCNVVRVALLQLHQFLAARRLPRLVGLRARRRLHVALLERRDGEAVALLLREAFAEIGRAHV